MKSDIWSIRPFFPNNGAGDYETFAEKIKARVGSVIPRSSNQFNDWLTSQNKRQSTIKQIVNYAIKYGHILDSGDASVILSMSPRNKQHTMEALANLSKFQGRYDVWLQIRQRYSLKWTSGNESFQALERFFNPEMSLDHMIDRVKTMMQVLPPVMSNIVRYAVLTGLRPSEAIESVKLLNHLPVNICSLNTSNSYYDPDQQTLRHYLFPDTFLRATKKAYLSYITPENLHPIANLGSKTPTWNAIRLACKHRKIDMDMRLCRKIFASHLRNSGIQPEVVDLLQGRVQTSVLTRHYLVPDHYLKADVIKALKQLEQRLR